MEKGQDLNREIKRSHERSREYGDDSKGIFPAKIIKGADYEKQLNLNEDLTEATVPIIKQLLKTLKESGFIIILTDSKAVILIIEGDKDMLNTVSDLNMVVGASMNEKNIGTNAIGTAIAGKTPVQITGKEDSIYAHHQWTCSAAPIHFEEKIIGTLSLAGNAKGVHSHTLGLVIAAADAIEFNLSNSKVQKELIASNQFAFAMMNNLSYGAFAIDLNDEIMWVNDTACRLINIRRKLLLSKNIASLLPQWPKMLSTVLNDLLFYDEENIFALDDINERFIFNAILIKKENKEILGYLLTFRPISRTLSLVKKYSGLQAFFTFDDIIAKSNIMRKLVQYAKKVSKSPSPILITGESGTGKEVFAQAIHNRSLRHKAMFVAINCGAISPSLIESELFGYERGAFTGASKGGKPGKFEIADGGTIFLDEIGDMPLDMQIKLLRVLQEGFVTKVGGHDTIKVDVRIIAASNKNIKAEVEKGNFRLDLFYRLNVIPIRIPSLKERKEDVLPLANLFLTLKASKLNKAVLRLNQEISNELLTYDWPGNVRELENYIEKLVTLDGNIKISEFEPSGLNQQNIVKTEEAGYKLKSLAEAEKEAIEETLKFYKNNLSKAAKELGIGRNTLYAKLKKYNLESSIKRMNSVY